jgi:hypothetical protein
MPIRIETEDFSVRRIKHPLLVIRRLAAGPCLEVRSEIETKAGLARGCFRIHAQKSLAIDFPNRVDDCFVRSLAVGYLQTVRGYAPIAAINPGDEVGDAIMGSLVDKCGSPNSKVNILP